MTKLVGGAFDRRVSVAPPATTPATEGNGCDDAAAVAPPDAAATVEAGDTDDFQRAWRRIAIRRAHRLELPVVAGRPRDAGSGSRRGVEMYRLVHEGRVVTQRDAPAWAR